MPRAHLRSGTLGSVDVRRAILLFRAPLALALLKEHGVAPGSTAVGMTGMWREGMADRHPNAEVVLSTLRDQGGFASPEAVVFVSEQLEREWEHAAARPSAIWALRLHCR